MAYNNYGYNNPGVYTPQYYTQPTPAMNSYQAPSQPSYGNYVGSQQQTPGSSGFVWVQGEAGAKAYPVAASNTVLLMDSENPVIYMKSTDQSGRPLPMRTFDLIERDTNPQWMQQSQAPIDTSQFVRMEDLELKVSEIVNKLIGGA